MGPTEGRRGDRAGDEGAARDEPAGGRPSGGSDRLSAEQLKGTRRLRLAAAVVLVQALATVGFALWLLGSLFVDEAYDTRNAIIEIVSFGLLGALMLAVAWGTWRARRFSRAAVVTVQLFTLLGVAVPLINGELWGRVWYAWWVGLPLAGACLLAGLAVLTPSATAVLYGDPDD